MWLYGDGGRWSWGLSGERKHDGENGEDKRQYKEKSGCGNGSMGMVVGGAGERKHDGENGEDKRQYKEKGG
jgi:hypothetical protein